MVAMLQSTLQRFDRLADLAWKLRLSVWTSFVVISGFMISTKDWKPNIAETVFGIYVVVVVSLTVIFYWGPYIYQRNTRLLRVAKHWEDQIENTIGVKIPDQLRPENFITRPKWRPSGPVPPWFKDPVYICQSMLTAVFALLPIVTLLGKYAH